MKYLKLLSFLLLPIIFNGQSKVDESLRKLETLLRLTDNYYVDSVDVADLVEKTIVKYLDELDPHSAYISKDEVEKTNEPLKGNFEGVGIQFNILYDTIMVVAAISGGPSEKLGIMAGDKIVKINQELVAGIGIKNQDVIDKLRGAKGTKVEVSIYRKGIKKLIDFEITRDKIPIFSVDAVYMAAPETGYIKVNRFSATTMSEFKNGLDSLQRQGAKNLILDLRGNSGGYLQTAIELSDEFLSNRQLIVYTEGRSFPKNEYFATANGGFEKGKLVVLIDNGSASASEIVSGAVQDWDRGLVVGRRSFGKGLVQKPYNLPDRSMVRLTVQRYHTPTGRCIQKPYEEYENDYLHRLENGEFFNKDSIKVPDSLIYYTPNDRAVYGGGGIIPDIFVSIDTSMNSDYYRDIIRKGLLYSFTIEYVDNNRKTLKKEYPTFQDFKDKFEVDESFLKEFFDFCESKELKYNEEEYKTSKLQIDNLLKANVARNVWQSSEFFEIYNAINPDVQKALEVLKDGTYEKMKLSN